MTLRSRLLGVAAVAALTMTPRHATAQACSTGYTFSLGLGGALSGCFTGSISEVGEDAGFISDQFYWAGNFGARSGATNAPTVAGTFMFQNGCGSDGNGTFAFCTGTFLKPTISIANTAGEFGQLGPRRYTGARWLPVGAPAEDDWRRRRPRSVHVWLGRPE